MKTVDIYQFDSEDSDLSDRYICTCINAEELEYNMALVERTKEDWQRFHTQQRMAKATDEYVKENLEEKERILDSTNLDRASVYSISQEKYKEANSEAVAKMYGSYYDDVEREEGNKVLVKVEKAPTKKAGLSVREKYNKYKDQNPFED